MHRAYSDCMCWGSLNPGCPRTLVFCQKGLLFCVSFPASEWTFLVPPWFYLCGFLCAILLRRRLRRESRLEKRLCKRRELLAYLEEQQKILVMEEKILHHLFCIKPSKWWDKLPTSSGAGFQPSTLCRLHVPRIILRSYGPHPRSSCRWVILVRP